MGGILILGELENSSLLSVTGELLAAGRSVSNITGDEVIVALLGCGMDSAANEAIAWGANRVYVVEDPLLSMTHIDAQLAAFENVCRQVQPSIVLVGKTSAGTEIGPRLAFRMGAGVAQDCVGLKVDQNSQRIIATRPVYGGNAMASVAFAETDPQVVVVRTKIFEPLDPDPSRDGAVETIRTNLDPGVIRYRLIETITHKAKGVRLEDAPVVVGGGRGLGGPESFELLGQLAQLLGGAIGASRAVCDAGWLDHSYQVGLTGKTITPDLYIAVGISGASQHMAGCSGAKQLVAINRDADANIFKSARFGVVGDWKNVMPSFIETVHELIRS